jgi:hypothetical protein
MSTLFSFYAGVVALLEGRLRDASLILTPVS